uniref:Uncharacterized protein n=1 Tax=Timema bartmani TaxID=61472 RepID=A0A7R9EXQ4_9NEOP|nr:unnamed protein product [Timema bartmani]
MDPVTGEKGLLFRSRTLERVLFASIPLHASLPGIIQYSLVSNRAITSYLSALSPPSTHMLYRVSNVSNRSDYSYIHTNGVMFLDRSANGGLPAGPDVAAGDVVWDDPGKATDPRLPLWETTQTQDVQRRSGRKEFGECVPATLVAVEQKDVLATLVAVEHKDVPATLVAVEQKDVLATLVAVEQKDVLATLVAVEQKDVLATLVAVEQKDVLATLGSWMTMFLTVIVSLYVFSHAYNLLLVLWYDNCHYKIDSKMAVTSASISCPVCHGSVMKAAACGTWLGDLITALMVTDMMLQDNLYPHWATRFRQLWRQSNVPRILIFWVGSVLATAVVVTLIVSDWISWDRLNRDFVATTAVPAAPISVMVSSVPELSRAFLASFILVMDLLIVMQDWDFPHFTTTLHVNLPGFSVATLQWKYAEVDITGVRFPVAKENKSEAPRFDYRLINEET